MCIFTVDLNTALSARAIPDHDDTVTLEPNHKCRNCQDSQVPVLDEVAAAQEPAVCANLPKRNVVG